MLITFRCKSTAEVLMLAEHAKPLLHAAGKTFEGNVPERGVFSPEQLDAAIAGLNFIVAEEPPHEEGDDDHPHVHPISQSVTLKQRAYPLLDMLKHARTDQQSVTWESASAW